MPQRRHLASRLLALAGATLLALCAWTAAARADSYGQLGASFATERGIGFGQLEEPTPAFGVDPTDNGVYTVDEVHGKYRIQKFLAGKAVASATFNPEGAASQVEGLAVDTKLERVYALVSVERKGA